MSGYEPDASAVVTFWRIWSATTPPVVALTLMFLCVLLKSSASWPSTLPAMSSCPCHIVISTGPPDFCVVAAAAAAAGQDGGRDQRGQEADADHFGTSDEDDGAGQVARAVGVEAGGLGEGDARPLGEHERGERVEIGRDGRARRPRGRPRARSSAGPNEPHDGARAGDADRAVAVLEGRVGLGPRLGRLAQLQRRLARQPDGPAAAEERPAVGLARLDRQRRVERGRWRRRPRRRGRAPRGRAAG